MAVKQTHIPDIDTIRNLTHKQFYQRIRNRLETLGKSAEWRDETCKPVLGYWRREEFIGDVARPCPGILG